MPILIIAEKDKAARFIAEAIGIIKITKKTRSLKIYEIPASMIYVIPLRGHILEYKNSKKYRLWAQSNPREIITDPESIEKVPIKYARPYINVLKEYSKICDCCVIATDADVEGCNIGLFDALPFVKKTNPNIKVLQMWLSSLQKNEILDKFKSLIAPKWNWGEAGEARAIIDAIIGFSATREITNTFQPLLKKLNKNFVSIGRVQTCLLYLIYLRDEQINKFLPEPYYNIDADLIINHNTLIKAHHQKNPFRNKEHAKAIYQDIKDEKFAKLLSNITNEQIKTPPSPLNTSKALILLTKNLKISANLAMKTLSDLYLNKIISYPRTESDVYKDNFNHLELLNKFVLHSQYGSYVIKLLQENRIKPTRGKIDAGDHPPITPLESLDLKDSRFENEIQRRVYNLLVRHYLALFGKNALESRTVLELLIKEEPFTSRLIALIEEGFFEIVPFLKIDYNSKINIENNHIPIKTILFNEKTTQPLPKYTDSSLLKLMERNHLGTKATRPIIIQILLDRELIYRNNKSQYYCSELGIFLIEILKDIWLPFLKPDFTRFTEENLEDIKENNKNMNAAIDIVKKKFLELFDNFIVNKKEILPKIENFQIPTMDKAKYKGDNRSSIITKSMCPFCKNSPMRLITTRLGIRFLMCINEQCHKKYLLLPKKGKIIPLITTCSLCGFDVFKIKTKKNNKFYTYNICPNCWIKGPRKEKGKNFCSHCENFQIINGKCVKRENINIL